MVRPMSNEPDFMVINHGSIIGFKPMTSTGQAWLEDLDTEGWQWMGDTLLLDQHSASALITEGQEDGMTFWGLA